MTEDTNEETDDDSGEAPATEAVTTEQPEGEEDGRPEIGEEDRAEMDLSAVAEDIEDTVSDTVADETEQQADTESGGDETAEDTPDTTDDDSGDVPDADGETWGDMYVEVLSVLLVEAVDHFAEDDDDGMTAEEIATLATQPPVNLPRSVNRLAEDMGTTEDLPPAQAVLLSTGLLAVVVLAQETDLVSDLLGEVMSA